MASVFLDANVLIDLAERKKIHNLEDLSGHVGYISPLSFHILAYAHKYKIPHRTLADLSKIFNLVNLTSEVFSLAVTGPTSDLEDNIQLHSAVRVNSDVFLTSDKKLLDMKFFGKMRMLSTLEGYEG